MVLPKIIGIVEGVLETEQKIGSFISGAPPASALGQAVQNTARSACDRVSAVPGQVVLSRTAFSSAQRICQQYWDDQGYSAPEATEEFPAAQCPTPYRFGINGNAYGSFCSTPQPLDPILTGGPVMGPIQSSNLSSGGPGDCGPASRRGFTATVVDANGATFTLNNNNNFEAGSVFIEFERTDGGPDDCGDPVTIISPGPTPAPDPGPGFDPTVNPYGDIPEFPVPITYPDPVFGEEPVPAPLRDPAGGPTPTAPATDSGNRPPDSGDSSADDPPDGEMGRPFAIGAVVAVTKPPDGSVSEYLQAGGPNLTIPRHGTLYFSLSLGVNGNVWSTGIPVQNRRVFVPTPEGYLACAAVFAPFNGSEATVELVRIPTDEQAEENGDTC